VASCKRLPGRSREPLLDGVEDRGWGHGAEAFERFDIRAVSFKAGHAGEIQLQDVIELAVRARAARFGGAEQRDHGCAQRGGDVHRTGVVADHQLAEPDPLDHFRQGKAARQIKASRRVSAGDDLAKRAVLLAAENGEPEAHKFREESARKLAPQALEQAQARAQRIGSGIQAKLGKI